MNAAEHGSHTGMGRGGAVERLPYQHRTGALDSRQSYYGPNPKAAKLMKTRTYTKMLMLLSVAIMAIGCATMREQWGIAQSSDTVIAYEKFLRKYPEGELAEQARTRLEELYAKGDWASTKSSDTTTAYEEFIRKHPKSQLVKQARTRWQELVQQAAQRYMSSLGSVRVQEVKFSEWTLNNRSKQEMEEIRQLFLDSVKGKGIKITDSDAAAILRISYEEMSWLRIGGPAGVDYTLTFTLGDKIDGDLIRNEYKGTITARAAEVTDDQGNIVRKFLGISETFQDTKETLKRILEERNPLTTDEKTQYVRMKQ